MRPSKTLIIAEAGVNHNGSLKLAKRLVDAAKKAGADIVKFQSFRTDEIVTRVTPKARYQETDHGSSSRQFEMLRKLELSPAAFGELAGYCKRKRIEFLATPFDPVSLHFLKGIGMKRIKISSGELTNGPLLLAAARTRLPVILATGMSDLSDVREALAVLAFGYLNPVAASPTSPGLKKIIRTGKAQKILQRKVTLLHCTTEYPAPFEEVNLKAMDMLRNEFGCAVGLSDHTPGIAISLGAAARGAAVVEKHFTLSRKMPGPDHKASLEPFELRAMVEGIRQLEKAMGDGVKRVMPSEKKNVWAARRSLVAARSIRRGELFSKENLTAKRAGKGLTPMAYWDFMGKKAQKNYAKDQKVKV